MEIITVEELKDHIRVVHDDEDTDIQLKVDAANSYVSSFLGTAEANQVEYEPPADVKLACLLIGAHWFENRENSFAGAIQDIPLDASEILLNHQAWGFA